MADDVNKPRGPKGVGGLASFENVMRKFEQATKPGVLETRLQQVNKQIEARIANITEQINQAMDLDEGLKKIAELSRAGETVQQRLSQEQAARSTRSRRTFEEGIVRFAGQRSTAGRMRELGEDPSVFTTAARHSHQKSFIQLQSEQQAAAERAQELRDRMVELSQDPRAGRQSFEQLAAGVGYYESQEAIAAEAMGLQRSQGRGIRQRYTRGTNTVERIETERRRRELFESVSEGGEVKRSVLGRDLENARDQFLKTFRAWQTALESGTGNLEELSAAAEAAESNLEDIEAVAGKLGVTPGGGGILDQIGEFFGGKMAAGIHIGAEAARGVGQLTRFLGSEFRTEQTQTQLQSAAFANRQYEDMLSATRRRDVAAMRRLMSGYRTVDEVAEEVRLAENVGFGLEAGADFAQGVVNTAQQGATGQVRDFAAGTRSTVVGGVRNLVRGTSGVVGEQASMRIRQAALELFDATQRVRNVNTQAFADFGFEAGLATRGGGSRRNEIMGGFADGGIRALAGMGISPEDAIALTRMGVQNMGAAFAGRNTLMRAGAAQQAGMLSADQYIQAASEMTAIGGGADQLEKIMRQAVAAGMDNSKNIQQMMSATIMLSRTAALTGQNVSGGTAELLAQQMMNLQDVAPNQRAAMAANAQMAAMNLAGDRSYNLMTVFRGGLVRRDFSDVDFATKQRLMTVQPNEVQSLFGQFGRVEAGEQGAESQFIKEVRKAGLGTAFLKYDAEGNVVGIRDDAKTRINTLVRHQREIGQQATTKFGMMISDQETRESIATGRPNARALDIVQAVEATEGNVGRYGVLQAVGRTAAEKGYNKTGGMAGEAELERERSAMTAAKQIEAAVKNFAGDSGKLSDALKQLNKDFEKIAKSPVFDPKRMEDNAQKAADTFRQPATDIKIASDTFKAAVAKFAETVGADQELKELLREKSNELKSQDTGSRRKPHPKYGN